MPLHKHLGHSRFLAGKAYTGVYLLIPVNFSVCWIDSLVKILRWDNSVNELVSLMCAYTCTVYPNVCALRGQSSGHCSPPLPLLLWSTVYAGPGAVLEASKPCRPPVPTLMPQGFLRGDSSPGPHVCAASSFRTESISPSWNKLSHRLLIHNIKI